MGLTAEANWTYNTISLRILEMISLRLVSKLVARKTWTICKVAIYKTHLRKNGRPYQSLFCTYYISFSI